MTKQPPPRTYFSGCFKLTSGPPEDGSGCGPEAEAEQLLELLNELKHMRGLAQRLLCTATQQCANCRLNPGNYMLVRCQLERLETENFKQQAAARRLLKRLLAAEAGAEAIE